jgi:hypothetical protein
MQADVNNPATWHLMMLRAIAGLQAGDKSAATAYLQFVQLHRGREVSEQTKRRLVHLAQTSAFADAQHLLQQALQPKQRISPASGRTTRTPRKASSTRR